MSRTNLAVRFVGLIQCAVLISLLISGPSTVRSAEKTRLTVEYWGWGDVTCSENGEITQYTGGMHDVRVVLLPDGKRPASVHYTGIGDWSWPEGLSILAGSRRNESERPVYSEGVRSSLGLTYYITQTQVRNDRVWRITGEDPILTSAPEYHFAFTVPATLAGQYLCVSAEWDHPRYGRLVAEEPACIKIVEPCSQTAQHKAWSSVVYNLAEQNRAGDALSAADSFLTLGWSDLQGLI